MDRRKYHTKGRALILGFLEQSQSVTVTAKDIWAFLQDHDVTVNRSTIYRYLNQLCDDGAIMKYTDNDIGKTVYEYVKDKHDCQCHIHLKCVRCNGIIHLECGFMEEIREHLEASHHFSLQCEGSVLYGLCDHCRKIEEQAAKMPNEERHSV